MSEENKIPETEEQPFQLTDEDKKFIDEYFRSANILISHSEIYRENYKPHYLVISKSYLPLI